MSLLETIRYCTECGHATELGIESGRLRPICPQCGHVFYFSPLVTVTAILENDGRVLLVKRSENPGRGLWAFPGGFVEADELLYEGLRREILEEAGLEIEPIEMLGVWSFFHEIKRIAGVSVFYLAIVTSGEPIAGSDSEEVGWFTPDEAFGLLAFQSHREALAKWQDHVKHSVDGRPSQP